MRIRGLRFREFVPRIPARELTYLMFRDDARENSVWL